jgi:hypothetical protein
MLGDGLAAVVRIVGDRVADCLSAAPWSRQRKGRQGRTTVTVVQFKFRRAVGIKLIQISEGFRCTDAACD